MMDSTLLKNRPYRLAFALVVSVLLLFSPVSLWADNQAVWDELAGQANTAFELENYEQAVSKAIEALEFSETHFGNVHPVTATSYYLLATFYADLGYAHQAIPLYEHALGLTTELFGADQPESIAIMSGLAELYAEQARYDDALPLLEQVLDFKKTHQGEYDSDTLLTTLTLAQIREGKGQYEEAERLYLQVLIQFENTIGPDHPDTLFANESLASVYKTQGKFEKAKVILETVYDKKTDLLGAESPETIITLGSLAEVNHKLGYYDEAETLYLKTIDLAKEAIGQESPEVILAIANLALLYQDQGRYPQAEKLFLQVYEFDKRTLGEDHPNTVIDLNNLAGLYRLQGQYGKSEEAYVEALALIKEVLGEKHPETISITNNLALLFENQGLFDQAEPLYKTALNNAEEVLGNNHPTTLALMNNLASLYESQGVFDRSEPLYLAAIQLNIEVYGQEHPNTIAGVNNLGYLYLMQKEYQRAEPLFTKVYETWRAQLGEEHQNTLKSQNNLARVYHWQGKIKAAESMFVDSLRLRKKALGEKHPDVVRSMVDLSALYITQKKYATAEELLLKTIALAEEVLGEKHEYTFEALNNLAELYEKRGEIGKAIEIMQIGFNRRTEFFERVLWAAGENTRQSYIELHQDEYHRFLSLLLDVNNRETALMALNASIQRKSLLLKITSEINKIVKMTASPELAEKARALDQKRKQLASMALSGPVAETPEEFRKTVAKLENELGELQAELGRASQIYYMTSKPISVDNVFQNLEPEDVLVDYLAYKQDGSDKMFAVVAQTDTENCFVWWKCLGNKIDMVPLGDLEEIKRVVDIFRETIQDEEAEEEDFLETGFDVYAKIWKPLKPYIKSKTSIYVVPDSILHLVPFDAIVNENENYLIESRDLKFLSSTRDLVVSALPDAKGQFLIVAGPDYDLVDRETAETKKIIASKRSGLDRGMRMSNGLRSLSFEPLFGAEAEGKTIKEVADSFADLPGAGKEGESIMTIARDSESHSIIYLNEQAEEEQLRVLQKSPQMIHIATHGFFLEAEERLKNRLLSLQRGGHQSTPPPGDNPLLRAGLAFAGINSNAPFLGEIDTDNDGVLTAMEVLGLDLSGTRLVVLSACDTGVGEIHAGEGVYGLRRAFQEAGVKSVVNSLWPVSDEGTRRLMTSFYKHMFNNVPPREALKKAQLEMLNSGWSSPYYWASFVLVERRFDSAM